MLKAKDVSQSAMDEYLTVTKGSISDSEAVKAALLHKHPSSVSNSADNAILADIILSGIGLPPTFLTEVTICKDAVNAILKEVEELSSNKHTMTRKKPRLAVISTTGISSQKRDVPLALLLPYHLLGFRPHADKRNMEKAVITYWNDTPEDRRALGGYMMVRPSLLTDGKENGLDSIRAGNEAAPAVGYTIAREDVGLWVFENVVEHEWGGARGPISITY